MEKTERKFYEVWYAVDPHFLAKESVEAIKAQGLTKSHRMVMRVLAEDMEEVFKNMQGEVWSPNGEARPLIRSLGLRHTSMSVGDVVVDIAEKRAYVVENEGFGELAPHHINTIWEVK